MGDDDSLRISLAVDSLLSGRKTPFVRTPNGATRIPGPAALSSPLIKMIAQPDKHCPYHDKRAHELILRVMEVIKPEVMITLGDHFDFFAISDHAKDPRRKLDFAEEIRIGDQVLREYEQLNVLKRKFFVAGNHEYRLDRYIEKQGTEIYRALAPAGLLQVRTLPEALDFKARGWEWIPYKDYGRIGDLHFTHDVERAGKAAHEHAQQDFETSSIIGHTHRLSLMVRGNHVGQWRYGAMFGWLGDWRAADYRHRMKVKREWPLGFGMIYAEKSTDMIHVQPILIHTEKRRYKCVVDGKLFSC